MAKNEMRDETRVVNTYLRSSSPNINKNYIQYSLTVPTRIIDIPDVFDGRVIWKACLSKSRDQGKCGSCWAFSSTSAMADRFCIQSMGLLKLNLSPLRPILCDLGGLEVTAIKHYQDDVNSAIELESENARNSACTGNSLLDVSRYLYLIGTNIDKCMPYSTVTKRSTDLSKYDDPNQIPLCTAVSGPFGDMCSDYEYNTATREVFGTPARFYRILSFYGIKGVIKDGGSELYIRDNIYKWGPIATGMKVYSNFYTFDAKNEIYSYKGKIDDNAPGHAIVLVGWGVKNSVKYWIARNTWGESWGMNGYFYIKRGNNECQLEENCIGIVPDFFYKEGYLKKSGSGEPPILPYLIDKVLHQERVMIDTDITTSAGGIDPTTGYTRRVMNSYPWIDFTSPINNEDLPTWGKWVAGINATPKGRELYIKKLNIDLLDCHVQDIHTDVHKDVIGWVFLIILVVIIIVIILFKIM